jgi:selenocysteine lyase/cysteine desulfurase
MVAEDRSLSFKGLFTRSLSADPDRLHFAAHSHHLWPNASYDGQLACWNDAATLADRKWDKVMGEVYPEAQGEVAEELGTGQPDAIVFAPNTHELLLRLFAACSESWPIRVLTSDGEFHSARRQFARWEESGAAVFERIPTEPFETFSERFLTAVQTGSYDFIFISQVLFNSGRTFDRIEELAALSRSDGPWAVIDGYHAFMAVDRPFSEAAAQSAFYVGGGYKYAMAGEGCAFMHAPPDYGPRPRITGWFAEFEDLTLPPGKVGYAKDASRFLGATFDPSALYRFTYIRRMLRDNGLTTARISAHVEALQSQLLDAIHDTAIAGAEPLNPRSDRPHARFLAFRSPHAQRWH